jgi:hypothetical protein
MADDPEFMWPPAKQSLDASVAVKWPLAVGTYRLDGRAVNQGSGKWDFRPGSRLSPEVENVDAFISCCSWSRPNQHTDQLLSGTLRIDEVRERSIRGNLELVSKETLNATISVDFEVTDWRCPRQAKAQAPRRRQVPSAACAAPATNASQPLNGRSPSCKARAVSARCSRPSASQSVWL